MVHLHPWLSGKERLCEVLIGQQRQPCSRGDVAATQVLLNYGFTILG